MDKKDKQIERLFDEYANSLEPKPDLSERARQSMRAKREHKARRPAAFWAGLAAVCGALVIAVFGVAVFLGKNDGTGGNSDGDKTDNSAAAPDAYSYTVGDVLASAVDADFAGGYISTSSVSDAQIFSEKYYACYIKDTQQFAYLKAVLGVTYNGGNFQIGIIVEEPQFSNNEREKQFVGVISDNDYLYSSKYEKGEYVTMAYLRKNGYKYYVTAMGNATGAQEVAAELIGANK